MPDTLAVEFQVSPMCFGLNRLTEVQREEVAGSWPPLGGDQNLPAGFSYGGPQGRRHPVSQRNGLPTFTEA